LLLPHAVVHLAGITQHGIVFSLGAAAGATPNSDLLLLPPVLAGHFHLGLG
jgi:hypothetical protein